ncbi:NACHT domain-containing NTPase [Nostoc linckia FACHB-104]|nr:NACHT domain-containing NTPase [Nostoc linckia FACHB-104]
MIVEWLVGWVASNTVGFLVKNILTSEFAQDLAKDYAKDFFKDRFNSVPDFFKKEPIQKAIAKALKEFLQLLEDELKFRKLPEEDIKKFDKPLKKFIYHKSVKEILGKAFEPDCDELDYQTLESTWKSLNLPALPARFNWQLVTDNYLRKCQKILAESKDLQELLDSRNLEAIKENTQEIAGIKPEFDLRQYQEAIRERYVNLKLDSLDTSGYAYNELRLWSIFTPQNVREIHQVLPQIHELPKEHLRRLRESEQVEAEEISLEELEKYKRVYFEQPISSVLNIVQQPQTYKYIVILGDPGAGKSTLLQYLALDWVEKTLDQLDKPGFILPPIPLLIELRAYMRNADDGHCKNFLEFFHQSPGAISHLNQHQLQAQLKAGNALVMFDGLDEVFDPGKREDVITAIHRFTNEYPNVQVIVTSRVIGYKPQQLRDAQFHHFMLQDLDSSQIQDFIYRWHELTFSDVADKVRKRERLQRGIETSKAITELAGNPLLLTMMAILNRNQELPRDRAELYNQASRVLLHQWDVERALVEDKRLDPKTIDYKDKQAMLRQVAYYMQTGDKGLAGNLIKEDDLVMILTDYLKTIEVSPAREAARVMINQLRTRNFMLCFLGADYYAFVHRTFLEYFCAWEFVWQFEKERSITIDYLKNEVFGKHWQDETWHEVLLLIAGMIEPKFVGAILDYLMANDGEREKFVNLFLAAKCLAEVRNRSVIASTTNELLNKIKALTSYDLWYYYDLFRNREEIKLVQEIRTQAVAAIATTWQESLSTKSWLKDRATQDDDSDVRRAAIQELAKNFLDDPDTKTFLKDRATQDDDNYVRRAAIQELAKNFLDDPDIKTFLKDRATQDDDSDVRGAAIQELAKNFPDDPDIKTILKDRATQDDSVGVRLAAIQELAKNFKSDPAMLEVFYNCGVNDSFDGSHNIFTTNPRYIALDIIIKQFPQHSQTLPLLREKAENDPDEEVRKFAQKKLKRWGVQM